MSVKSEKKSILLLPALPERDASSRFRIYKYIPYLEKHGFNVTVLAPITASQFEFFYDSIIFNLDKKSHLSNFRVLFFKNIKKIILYLIIIFNRLKTLLFFAGKYDAVIVHRMICLGQFGLFERILYMINKNIIYDFDDALFLRHRLQKGMKTIGIFKAIIAGNEFLANYARNFSDNVFILPTSVDLISYPTSKKNTDAEIVIGWIGNPFNLKHIYYIKEALIEILKSHSEVRLSIVCDGEKLSFPKEILKKIDFVKWKLNKEQEFLHSFNIGIMPLMDDMYSKGKCGFKIIQYFLVAIPVVCSPIGINETLVENGINGYKASTNEEWVKYLEILIKDNQLRHDLGQNGLQLIKENFNIEKNASSLINIIEKVIDDKVTIQI